MYFKSFIKLLFAYIYFISTKKIIIILGPYEIRFISKFSFKNVTFSKLCFNG